MTINHDPLYVDVTPVSAPLSNRVNVPGSKSLTNRALLIAALANGTSQLDGALKSDDTLYMANALRAMGVTIDEPDCRSFIVKSDGQLHPAKEPLFIGNAGTAMRFLTATCASLPGTSVLTGDSYMQKRPIQPLIDALSQTGISIEATNGCPPVTVHGATNWSHSNITVDAAVSTQYISALLMSAPLQQQPITLTLPSADIGAKGYIELTIDVMSKFGVNVQTHGKVYTIDPQSYRATHYCVEPDASTATYFWAASAITNGQLNTGIDPTRMTQPDAQAYEWICQFPNMPPVIDGSQMQDAVPTLATLAALNQTPVKFTGLKNLRVKECDRVSAIVAGMRSIRENIAIEGEDWIEVHSDPLLATKIDDKTSVIDTHDDHRIAMAFAILGLKVPGLRIQNPNCVAKTFPNFWNNLEQLGVKLEWQVK